MITYQPPIILDTQPTPSYAVIWLHGLGANGHDFESIVPALGLDDKAIRFIFPHAANRAVTINAGHVMPAWYDIKGPSIADKEDRQGIDESSRYLQALIDQVIQSGIVSGNIVIAGFSQGGAVATYSLLRVPYKLAGCMALSTYVPFMGDASSSLQSVNKNTPIFWGHGTYDDVVPESLGKQCSHYLTELGYSIEWHSYRMGHSVSPAEIGDISAWFKRVFVK